MKRLRIGVAGAGVGAAHIEAFATLPDMYDVQALCDIDGSRCHEVADRLGIANRDTDFAQLLSRDLDIIDIATPSSLHYAQAVQAMRAGFDVILEKPVARSLAEVDSLAEIALETGQRIFPVFQYRFGHGIQKLHHLLRKGIPGRPSVATAETHWYRDKSYYDAGPWRGTWDREMGGCFTTHAIHIHDLLCEVLGKPISVHARKAHRINGNETEDMGILSLEFDSGAMASSSLTLGSRQQTSRMRFCFENLVAESGLHPYNPGHEPWSFPHDDESEAQRIQAELADFDAQPERFTGLFHRLHQACTADAPLPVTLADARRSIELLTAVYWSTHSGETVSLPLASSHPFYNGWIDTMKSDNNLAENPQHG